MEAIDGIDLNAEALAAEAEILASQRAKVRAAIGGIVSDVASFRRQKIDLESQLAKIGEKIEKAEVKYKRIVAGDWSVLNENMLKGQPTPE